MCEQWWLHCTSQWGQWMLLSEHVYCVAITFKMTEQVEHASASNFSLSLNIPPWKLFGWFRRRWLWVTGDHSFITQYASSCLLFGAEFFDETSNHPGDSAPLQPTFGALQLLAFPQTKITFERQEISDYQWDSGKYNRAADGNWENCVRSQGAYFEGDWGVIILCTMLLVSYIFFSKYLYFS